MRDRFAKLVYLLLHIPLLFLLLSVFSAFHTEPSNLSEYNVRCLSNDKLVVLQGITDNSQ